MSPADIAATHPDKPAYIMAETGDTVTFAQLEATANQGAQLFRSLGFNAVTISLSCSRTTRAFSRFAGQHSAPAFTTPPSAGGSSKQRWTTL